ncbi:MAG: Fe-S cluster assembly protein SufD [Rhodospirillales bacterium]|nr:Fe-S cluster assembly protein SufD [Rhodospirillales bacterium]
MSKTLNPTQHYVDHFGSVKDRLPGAALPWLDARRVTGIEQFARIGLPTVKTESWKYTRLPVFADTDFRAANWEDGQVRVRAVPEFFPGASDSIRLVYVNGIIRPELSRLDGLPAGVSLEPMAQVLESDPAYIEAHLTAREPGYDQGFSALNAAMMESGTVFRVAKGVVVTEPIEIVYLNGGTESPIYRHPRNLFVLEPGSQATLIKRHAGIKAGAYFNNGVTDIQVGDGAILRHYTIQADCLEAIHLSAVNVTVGRDATYESFNLAIGGRLVRTETRVRLEGRGGHCNLSGAYLMKAREHCDNTTIIDHLVPDTTAREVFKGVLNDESRGVFQGKLVVHKDAQRTDGHQMSRALLLSDRAEMDAKPELEIYADDVKCSHGCTTGQIDETALFYLRSRGIPEALARNLLIQSFIAEALEEISDVRVREAMASQVIHWLPAQCFLSDEWRQA